MSDGKIPIQQVLRTVGQLSLQGKDFLLALLGILPGSRHTSIQEIVDALIGYPDKEDLRFWGLGVKEWRLTCGLAARLILDQVPPSEVAMACMFSMSTKSKGRGFASMDQGVLKKLASKGGRTAQAQGTAHRFDSLEASEAGKKSGEMRRKISIALKRSGQRRRQQTADVLGFTGRIYQFRKAA